jgi:hypothetical protein
MSIHKSQGQTLPKVKVDLHSIFEKGTVHLCSSLKGEIGFSANVALTIVMKAKRTLPYLGPHR